MRIRAEWGSDATPVLTAGCESGLSFDPRRESKSALKVSLRSLLLVAAGSGLWHLPVQNAWLRAPVLATTVFVMLYATAGALVSATIWRNILAQVFGVGNDRRVAVIALTGLCLGVFLSIGLAFGR